jgi:histidinol-phosphate aminotransferase
MKFKETLKKIKNYEAGKPIELVVREFGIAPEDVIKLASNENPLGTSPKVQKKLCEVAKNAYLYPDDSMFELKEALGKRFDVDSKHIIIGAGSDQILEFISRAKLDQNSSVLMSQVTFAMYPIYAMQEGAQILRTPSFEHRVDEFKKMIKKHHPDIIYICTPNNPTGDATKKEDVFEIINAASKESLVVVDGAYMEYARAKDISYSLDPKEILKFENAIYLGTFSKAYGLGGMRVGYAIANEEIIKNLYKLRPPFNITTLSLAGAIEALKDEEFVQKAIRLNFEEMKKYQEYAKKRGFKFIESFTNFITLLFPEKLSSKDISQKLLKKGIIIRDLSSYNLNGIRVTIGLPHQNEKLFKVLDEILDAKS